MSDIKDWSTTAASNNSASPNGFPEGMAPSGVNDSAREVMASVREFYDNPEWRDWGHTITYGSATTFTTAAGDGDTTGVYLVGRRIKAVGSTTTTIYGRITASSHSSTTTVTVVWDSGNLENEALTISVGADPTGDSIGYDALFQSFIHVRDKKTSGTQGGTCTAGSWQTRDINEEVTDTGSNCSVSSNQITLDAGTYETYITVPGYDIGQHQGKLYDTTGTADLILGSSAATGLSSNADQTLSIIMGRFTLSAQSVLEVQHRSSVTHATNGFGRAGGWGDEIYVNAIFKRVG